MQTNISFSAERIEKIRNFQHEIFGHSNPKRQDDYCHIDGIAKIDGRYTFPNGFTLSIKRGSNFRSSKDSWECAILKDGKFFINPLGDPEDDSIMNYITSEGVQYLIDEISQWDTKQDFPCECWQWWIDYYHCDVDDKEKEKTICIEPELFKCSIADEIGCEGCTRPDDTHRKMCEAAYYAWHD